MRKQFKLLLVVLVPLLLVGNTAKAQDFLLSQPWAATTTIAPSFAGFTGGGRVFATYRNQWSSIKGSQTGVVGYDQYFHPIRSSFGAVLDYTSYADGMISQTDFAIQYNYLVKMTKDWYFRPGLQVGLFYRTLDPTKLLFVDQIAMDGTLLPTTSYTPEQTSMVRFDAAVSIMFYGPYFFGGANVSRLLGNSISFSDNPTTTTAVKLNVFAAGMIPITKSYSRYAPKDDITIAALYQWQGQYHQIDLDVMYHRQYFMAGIGYRGIPFVSPQGLTNTDALKVTIGGSIAGFSLSYSYDISLSSLVNVSGGSHEIVLTYRFLEKPLNDRSFFCY